MLVKTPARLIPFNNGNFGPSGSHLYYVKDGDNWGSVATRDGWANAKDFVEFNFQTRDPEEVNWYLQNFVGCTVSKDGKNYSFSSSDAVRMTDGSSQRGHIFTKNDIVTGPPVPLDDNDVARESVLKVLGETGTLSRIRFEMFTFHIDGPSYGRMKKYVEKRSIRVRHNSSLAADGRYDWESDTLNLGFTTAATVDRRSLIVHELTHAIMDERAASWLTRKRSEAIAFAAQCIYASELGYTLYNAIPGIPATGDDRKFEVGEKIAAAVARGTHKVPTSLENEMIEALKGDSHYGHYSGNTFYNGIIEREDPDWGGPVIPSQI
ncbi:hypothetical protein Pan44_40400 [Caulifigura coniformis]|uniref:Uncharacterized protein n=1 Tax=Caulifigura coniformis TaxID=2527983 RepID=A0A517SIN1_9PLAN|nr:hypothetical protein [Caulifigura coniformis]QDT55991.1 hypothetical protein Pan44_40400 [Caulifigura coniformis]